MPSQRQIQANRRNARRSTGPRTSEGKAACAANAVTHGFSARSAVLPSETASDFHQFVADLEREFQRVEMTRRFTDQYPDELPDDPALAEIGLLGRALMSDAAGSDPLSKLSRHEARLSRRYFKTLAQLRKARAERRASAPPQSRPAAVEQAAGQPENPHD